MEHTVQHGVAPGGKFSGIFAPSEVIVEDIRCSLAHKVVVGTNTAHH